MEKTNGLGEKGMTNKNITFCIPTKDNLRYLKGCIESIIKNSIYDNEILVWVDSDNDGTIDWLDKNDIKYMVNKEDEQKELHMVIIDVLKRLVMM